MKRIITHFLGDVSFEPSNLQRIADDLDPVRGQEQPQSDSIDSNDAALGDHYSVDLLSTSTMRMFRKMLSQNSSTNMSQQIIRESCPIGISPECLSGGYELLGTRHDKMRYAGHFFTPHTQML